MTRILTFIGAHLAIALAVVILWTVHVQAGRLEPEYPYSEVHREEVGAWTVSCDFNKVKGTFEFCTTSGEYDVMGGKVSVEFGLSVDSDGGAQLGFFLRDSRVLPEGGYKYGMKVRFKGRHEECRYNYTFTVKSLNSGAVGKLQRVDKDALSFMTAVQECNSMTPTLEGNDGKHEYGTLNLVGTYEAIDRMGKLFTKYRGSRDM